MSAFATTLSLALMAQASQPAPASSSEDGWRSTRPELGPTPGLVLPSFQQTTLENGLTVVVAELHRLPLVAFQLVTKGGAALDPKDGHGLGNLVYAMLDEGAGERDALAFSDALADLGASLSASCGRDRGGVSISGLARHQEALVDLLADAVLRPRLADVDFNRIQAKTAAGIQARLGSPNGLATMRLPALIYGPDHPLGHPQTGSLADVRAATLAAVKAHHGRLLSPQRSAFVAVGDVTLPQAVALAEKAFGAWPRAEEPAFAIPPVAAKERQRMHFVNKPGSPQTMALLGRPLFGRGHPDEDALKIANDAFGGSFSSRLNMNLREDKGYTYGAGSQVSFRNGVGVFISYAALQRAFSAPGLKEFFVELEAVRSRPFTEDEIARVKAGRIRSLPGSFEGVGSLAGAAAQLFAYGLPLDHFEKSVARIEAVTPEAARAAAQKYLEPGVMQVLLVGDAKTVTPALEDMGFSPLDVQEP